MYIRWRKLFLNLLFWACAEIILNLNGIDDFIDYGEYIITLQEIAVVVRQNAHEQLIPMRKAVPEVLIST